MSFAFLPNVHLPGPITFNTIYTWMFKINFEVKNRDHRSPYRFSDYYRQSITRFLAPTEIGNSWLDVKWATMNSVVYFPLQFGKTTKGDLN